MGRRLSITVPDELWDDLTPLDPSPSALVQRALRCLYATEGPGAGPTPIEAAAADIPYWQSALDGLTEQATELRAEGYEAVIMGTYEGVLTLGWLEMVAHQASVAICNAHLFTENCRRSEDLEQAQRRLERANAQLEENV